MSTKIATLKALATKATLALTAATALIVAAPTPAHAQEFAVGVRAGNPYFARPGFAFERRPEFLRREQFERRQAFFRHEEWARANRFRGFYR
jgi:hypothetical protein